MNRRKFLAAAAAPLAARAAFLSLPDAAAESLPDPGSKTMGWRRFEITTRVSLPAGPRGAQLWLPLAQTAGGYQTALDLRWKSTGETRRVRDARYGAPILFTDWGFHDHDTEALQNRRELEDSFRFFERTPLTLDASQTGQKDDRDTARRIEVVQTIATQDRAASPFQPLNEAERKFWTEPTPNTPIDGVVRDTAARITVGLNEPRERLRAIYDWVVSHTHRDPQTPGCGRGDIQAMLQRDQPGGKCADINGLMVGLARAAGFPARDVYGIRVAESRLFPCLGHSGNISRAQHCRAEIFLDDEGWFPVDPADVRKVMLEEKTALDDAGVRALRDRLFGSWEMNWIGYNNATDVELPFLPYTGSQKPDLPFLMYPCGFTADKKRPCLDPEGFRYEITSRELAV